ncbi:unnamed protein product [Cyprideis torosa]|uniref:Uncharacterized protein n=1 Tax=Cyprideis torosa TaxID=163714 RepID=A0A7R8WDB6_9CRUS|nr:unnamed protein product [Cyprideis torosa]CAG0894499.1 unnamed protein product [Cyprideis torosa]
MHSFTVHHLRPDICDSPFRKEIKPQLTVEDWTLQLCRFFRIKPLYSRLFGLREIVPSSGGRKSKGCCSNYWRHPSDKLEPDAQVEFRLRFWPAQWMLKDRNEMIAQDPEAFEYAFQQARKDFINGVIDISADKKDETRGLSGVLAALYMRENDTDPKETVKNVHLFAPSGVVAEQNFPFKFGPAFFNGLKSKLEDALQKRRFSERPLELKGQFLNGLFYMCPKYTAEIYRVVFPNREFSEGTLLVNFHRPNETPGVDVHDDNGDPYYLVDTYYLVEDLICVYLSGKGVAIGHRNHPPLIVEVKAPGGMAVKALRSLIGCLDGYYRLTKQWSTRLCDCDDLEAPSLIRARIQKIHAPVGKDYAQKKLNSSRAYLQRGSYMLRESTSSYDRIWLDVCLEDGELPRSFPLDRGSNPEEWRFRDLPEAPLDKLLSYISSSEGSNIPLIKKISIKGDPFPPPVLLCRPQIALASTLESADHSIVFRRDKFVDGKERLPQSVCMTQLVSSSADRKAQYVLKRRGNNFFSEEDVPFKYTQNKLNITLQNLLDLARGLAEALVYLAEKEIPHGRVRCHNLLAYFTQNRELRAKLSDCGMPTEEESVIWLAPELRRRNCNGVSLEGDIFAAGLTLLQIFMWGAEPTFVIPVVEPRWKKYELQVKKVFGVVESCWKSDPKDRITAEVLLERLMKIAFSMESCLSKSSLSEYMVISDTGTVMTDLGTTGDTVTTCTGALISEDNTEVPPMPSLLFGLNQRDMTGPGFDDDDEGLPGGVPLLDRVQFTKNSLGEEKRLGEGMYGVVVLGTYQESNGKTVKVAIKKCRDRDGKPPSKDAEKDLLNEVTIMKDLTHPNIVRLIGVTYDSETADTLASDRRICLVMEYVPEGSLERLLISKKRSMKPQQLFKFAIDVAESSSEASVLIHVRCVFQGMKYLNEQRVIHRDLAARNVLVMTKDWVKVADFGLAHVLDSSDYYRVHSHKLLPLERHPLESLKHSKYFLNSDIHLYGIFLYELFSGEFRPKIPKVPLPDADPKNKECFIKAQENGLRLPRPAPLNDNFTEDMVGTVHSRLMMKCWADQDSRPSWEKVLQILQVDIRDVLLPE